MLLVTFLDVFTDVILQRLKWLAKRIYPESQCGYRYGRDTVDGIFTLHQLLEKSRERRRGLYMAFADYVKAYSQSRSILFIIPGKLGCSPKFTTIVYNRLLSTIVSGVKQGCKLASTTFGLYAAVLLWLACKKIKHMRQYPIKIRL